MSVHVQGTVAAPVAIRSHTEPDGPIEVGSLNGGQSRVLAIGDFKNTGNVNQTLELSASGEVGCSVSALDLINQLGSPATSPIVLQPGQHVTVSAEVTAESRQPGDTDEPLSFDVNSVWS